MLVFDRRCLDERIVYVVVVGNFTNYQLWGMQRIPLWYLHATAGVIAIKIISIKSWEGPRPNPGVDNVGTLASESAVEGSSISNFVSCNWRTCFDGLQKSSVGLYSIQYSLQYSTSYYTLCRYSIFSVGLSVCRQPEGGYFVPESVRDNIT